MAPKSFFQTIYDAAEEFIDDLRNNRPLTAHVLDTPDPPKAMSAGDVTRLRKRKLRVSQAVFANLLNTARQTVHAWEQGRNKPSGIALRLLRLVEARPEILTDMIRLKETKLPARRAANGGKARPRKRRAG